MLPSPRTSAITLELGNWLYLLGGDDGTGPVATVLRAPIR
jgi:hypothetical protein